MIKLLLLLTKEKEMNNDDSKVVVLVLSVVFGLFSGGFFAGYSVAENKYREEAKEAKVGEYYLNEKDQSQFRFIKPIKHEKEKKVRDEY